VAAGRGKTACALGGWSPLRGGGWEGTPLAPNHDPQREGAPWWDLACERCPQLGAGTHHQINTKSRPLGAALRIYPGGDLLSQALAHQVPSALRGLTSLFGMGKGVSPSP
jgi:hypothetical protein